MKLSEKQIKMLIPVFKELGNYEAVYNFLLDKTGVKLSQEDFDRIVYYRLDKPENKELTYQQRKREYFKEYHKNNKDKYKEYSKKYYQANKEKINEQRKRLRQEKLQKK